jgi:hypothetical protein
MSMTLLIRSESRCSIDVWVAGHETVGLVLLTAQHLGDVLRGNMVLQHDRDGLGERFRRPMIRVPSRSVVM